VPELPQELRRQCTQHLASIAVYGPGSPVEEGWLGRFLAAVEPDDRANWASDIGFIMRQLDEDATQDLWVRWLSAYWSLRNEGIPLPPGPDGLEKMIDWSPEVAPVFPEPVDRIRESTLPTISYSRRLYTRLEQRGYAARYPKAVASLLQHLLPNATQPFLACQPIAAMFPALVQSTGVPRQMLNRICDELARLGCQNAGELRRLLD
jgi:hypothetical protein